MDTLELAFEDRELSLETLTRATTAGTAAKLYSKNGGPCRRRPGFTTELHLAIDGHTVILASEPYGTNPKQLLIIIHCSHFKNLVDLEDWFANALGLGKKHLNQAQVQRLDCCVDVLVPWDTVVQAVYQKRCRNVWLMESTRKSAYLGKLPLQTCLYEKKVSPLCIDLIPRCRLDELKADKYILCTRIETRFNKHKLPIKSYSELLMLRDMNPFAHLTLQTMEDQIVQDLPLAKKDRVLSFQFRCQQVGAQAARKERNLQGHFRKNVGQYLKSLDLDLMAAWKNRTNRFFGTNIEEQITGFTSANSTNDKAIL